MATFEQEMQDRLRTLRAAGLARRLRRVDSPQGTEVVIAGRRLLNFSSNDYLGLAGHPLLEEASVKALASYGIGAGASRLICGSLGAQHDLEEALARFKGTTAALTFSTGYATALGTIGGLVGGGDVVVVDRLAHACLVDAVRLSGARLRVFRHNDPEDLERVLGSREATNRRGGTTGGGQVLVVTESVFSMDGDVAPLRDLVEVKDRHGAWLMVDEAHATGVYGGMRRGLVDEYGLGERVEVQMGTMGKALGVAGGYVAGSGALIELLVNRARSLIYSTAPLPVVSGAVRAALGVVESAEGELLCGRLWTGVHRVRQVIQEAGFTLPAMASPILPVIVGDERAAVALADALLEQGILTPAIRYPSVGRGAARLRLTVSAAHTEEQIDRLGSALRAARAVLPPSIYE